MTSNFTINFGQEIKTVISPANLLEIYFYGIDLCRKNGQKITNETIQLYIDAAIHEVENHLNIKLLPERITETIHYNRNDFQSWGFLPVSYQVAQVYALDGFFNGQRQINYPQSWLSIQRSSDQKTFSRVISLVPSSDTPVNNPVYSGVTPHQGFFGNASIPNYWEVTYCTGFDPIPRDILNVVGKLASINLFHILGDLILGAGIASQSIGIDGLSQSISTTSSATNAGYGSRIVGYLKDIKEAIPKLEATYRGTLMLSC